MPVLLTKFGYSAKTDIRIERRRSRRNMIQHLEQADETAAFDRFLDLPPELRNRIYSYHLESSGRTTRLHPPPITMVFRQLHQETVLLYYHTCTVCITFSGKKAKRRVATRPERTSAQLQVAPNAFTEQMFLRAPKICLGNIRKLRVTIQYLHQAAQ
jgi:hypothetical protein